MSILPNFVFSQSSLQDYVDCARRFELRYIDELRWPAVVAEPSETHEAHMQRGADFHHMIHQHYSGVPAHVIQPADDELQRWWQAYLVSGYTPDKLTDNTHAEILLSTTLEGHRLLAKYDLITIKNDRITIIDWKTSVKRTSDQTLRQRLQTAVYPYVLVQVGHILNGGRSIKPEQITMRYWFTNAPDNPAVFQYTDAQYHEDQQTLTAILQDITKRAQFELTDDTRKCRFCQYRSLCDRGIEAGAVHEMEDEDIVEDDFDLPLDFDQIAEVEF